MSLEVDFTTPVHALPQHIPYQTPRRQASRHDLPSPFPSSSPPPPDASNEDHYPREKDVSNDANISVMDPRRFTPNLHASLVAEILSLRRENESKNSLVGALEDSLQESRNENGQLAEELKIQGTEMRSIKRQMQLLESGSHSAVGDIENERDGAVDKLSDTQKRLDTLKNKARAHELEMERTQGLWNRDRESWEHEKRSLELKIHVVEGRLKTVLMEVASAQANAAQQPHDPDHGIQETWFRANDSTNSNHTNSVSGQGRFSRLNNHAVEGNGAPNRFSTLSGPNGFDALKLNGLSLAEELEFDEDDEDEDDEDEDDGFDTDGGHASPDALPEEAEMRRQRTSFLEKSHDLKARKVLGLVAKTNGHALLEKPVETQEEPTETTNEKSGYFVAGLPPQNRDMGTQYSPLPSPSLNVQQAEVPAERNVEQSENAANQRRKRVSIPLLDQITSKSAVSASCQTEESPSFSPQATIIPAKDSPEMKSSTTQTDNEDVFMVITAGSRDETFMAVPTIEIHPPGSRPPSSHNGVVLPPRTKSVSCQASIDLPISVRSISIQTDGIRPDKRALKIPPRLDSVAGASRSASKSISWRQGEVKDSVRIHPAPRRSSRRYPQRVSRDPVHVRLKATMTDTETVDAYPGNNDNGPLNNEQASNLRRPIRDQSLFAGFESGSDGEAPQLPEMSFSDDDFADAPPIRKTLSKVQNSWRLVPRSDSKGSDLGFLLESENPDEGTNKENEPEHGLSKEEPAMSKRPPQPSRPAPAKPPTRLPSSYHTAKEPNIRKTALISSGAVAHATRPRSPSAPSPSNPEFPAIAPPFPVPTRSSSRRIPISASDGTRSPTPYSNNLFSASRRAPNKDGMLRKVRSATAVPKFGRVYHRTSRSRSPPPSTPSNAPESPQLPRMPHHDLPSKRVRHDQRTKDSSLSSFTPPVLEEPAEQSHNQPPSVVDAIAQTMVGEWMWKYVRRRKSFGISESPQVEFDTVQGKGEGVGSNGIRHKRWVWLAPYERAVMWSSKQPTSGTALLGKSGRKLPIQSVIDVKDDTPMPKNSEPQVSFNRSILILTPQRALKFTATSLERHHLWLRALSFLSQSSNDLANIPHAIQRDYPPPSRGSNSSRRTPFFDTVRSANPKRRPMMFDGYRAHTAPFGISQALGARVENGYPQVDEENNGQQREAAEAPHVPRVSSHTRKRSNTGPRSGPASISHTFTSKATMSSSNISLKASLARDGYTAFQRGSSFAPLADPNQVATSPIAYRNNFFDAVGTVRMEAFIGERDRYTALTRNRDAVPPSLHHRSVRQQQQQQSFHSRKKELGFWGGGNRGLIIGHDAPLMMHHSRSSIETRWKGDDPFKGF